MNIQMNYQMNGYNLSGSFRLSIHDKASIQFLRRGMGMSMNAIAEITGRSTATVKKCLDHAHIQMDNRGKTQLQHQNRMIAFQSRKTKIQDAFGIWVKDNSIGFIDALKMTINGFGRLPSQETCATTTNISGNPTMTQQRIDSGQAIQDSGNDQDGLGNDQEGSTPENSTEGEEEEPA